MRRQVSGVPQLVRVGYRGPKISRGLHPSGYTDNLVYNTNNLSILRYQKRCSKNSVIQLENLRE